MSSGGLLRCQKRRDRCRRSRVRSCRNSDQLRRDLHQQVNSKLIIYLNEVVNIPFMVLTVIQTKNSSIKLQQKEMG
jgi:hypothetical protein